MILPTTGFSGIAPRFSPHALQPNQAQTATNCRLWAGSLEPLPGGLSVATITGRAGVKKALYRMGHSAPSDTQFWLSWLTEVDVCRSPIAAETGERTYYTGDGVPKFTDTALATTGTPYPFASYDLGVPAPTAAPWLAVNGATPTATPYPAKIVLTPTIYQWLAVNTMIEISVDGGIVYAGTTLLSVTPVDITAAFNTLAGVLATLTGDDIVLTSDLTGPSAFLHFRWITSIRSAVGYTLEPSSVPETRVYVYTNVRDYGGFKEESAPSPVNIIGVHPTQTVTLSAFTVPPAGGHNITHRRFYRTATGSQGTNYYYVGEQATASTTFVDSVSGADLGEVLPSLTWDTPPPTLSGLVLMANGIMAGFVGKDVYFCDPYHPHAWPQGYIQTVDYDVVGLCAIGQSLVVLTKGHPYLVTGSHPDSMGMQKLDIEQACMSKRSINAFGQGCVYASPDGLVYVGNDGSDVISKAYATAKEWKALMDLSTLHGYSHDGRYYGFHSTGGFIFDPADRGGALSLHNILADAAYVDLQVDSLFYVKTDTVYKLHAGTDLAYTWRSKRHQIPKPYNFGCAQVLATDYTSLTFKLYVDGVATPKLTKVVTSGEPFRLPAGYLGRAVEFELTGTSPVLAVTLAGNPLELQNA